MRKFPSDILNEIRQHLEEEKRRIVARVSELSLQDPYANPDRLVDNAASDTEASEESDHDRMIAVIEQLKKQVEEIDNALMRIAEGNYGFCRFCRQMINTDRLAILPTATLCLTCERKKKKA